MYASKPEINHPSELKNTTHFSHAWRAALLSAAALLIAGAASSSAVQARDIYVSPSGSDRNPGTMDRPMGTPARAINLSEPGDTIILRAGVYPLVKALYVAKAGLTIKAFGAEKATIEAPSDDDKGVLSVIVIVADDVTLLGLDITGGAYYGVKVDMDGATHTTGVSIRKCTIHHTGRDSVKTTNADKLLIEDCEIGPSGVRDPSDAEGIDSIGSVGVIIRRCNIHDTATNGLYLKGGARNGVVESCRIERTNGFGGILLGQDTDIEFMRDGTKFEAINCIARNNIVAHTGAAGLATYSGQNIRFENNTLIDVASQVQAAFWVVVNSRRVPAEQITFKNNIVQMTSDRPFAFIQRLAGQLVCDSNLYFTPRGRYVFRRETADGREDQWDFAGWRRGLGVDGRSGVADAGLDAGAVFRPRAGSAAIAHGESLDEVKTDYSGNPRPAGRPCTIGAHEGAPASPGA